MSVRQGNKVIAGTTSNPDLFDYKWADHILDDASWLRADTFSWQSGSVYEAVYNHLVTDISGKSLSSETVAGITIQFYLADDKHKICPASEMANVAAIYEAVGIAWYYIIDTTNIRFKLPRTKFGFTGLRDVVGKYVEPGAPNIIGAAGIGMWNTGKSTTTYNHGINWMDFSGACYGANSTNVITDWTNTTSGNSTSWSSYGNRIGIDASRSNSIYGNSITVQPPATQMYLYFYVGNFTRTALENTAGLNASLFNNKVDIGHEVIAYQVPDANNNYTWYRKYADGWVEQGGSCLWTSGRQHTETITFPVPMANDRYSYSVTPHTPDRTAQGHAAWAEMLGVAYTTATGLKLMIYGVSDADVNNGASWRIEGVAAN